MQESGDIESLPEEARGLLMDKDTLMNALQVRLGGGGGVQGSGGRVPGGGPCCRCTGEVQREAGRGSLSGGAAVFLRAEACLRGCWAHMVV